MALLEGILTAAIRRVALGALLVTATVQAADLRVSGAPDRSGAVALEGAALTGNVHVFAAPATEIRKVVFYLDDATLSQPVQQENLAPFDFASTGPDGLARPLDTSLLSIGTHTISAQVSLKGGGTQLVHGAFTVTRGGGYALLNGSDANRSSPVSLDGATLQGDAFVHVAPAAGLKRVEFFLDNPQLTGSADQVERLVPWDLAGTGPDNTALPFDSVRLADGSHTLTARLTRTDGGAELLSASFAVNNSGAPQLTASPAALMLAARTGSAAARALIEAATNDGGTPAYTVQVDVAWLSVNGGGTLPDMVEVAADPSGLAAGTYASGISLHADGYDDLVVPITFRVSDDSGCSPLSCGELLVGLPYQLDFDADHGKLLDGTGIGTGFTYVQPTSAGSGYLPANLLVDTARGELVVTTTAGLFHAEANTQDNALGVGIDAPSQITELSTTLVEPPAGDGRYQQAGLWFGTDEDNYVKLVVVSTPAGPRLQHLHEIGGRQVFQSSKALSAGTEPVTLLLTLDPSARTVAAGYRIGGDELKALGKATVPEELFSFDAAGIDPTVGTRSFGGVFASHRNGTSPFQYRFDHFTARAVEQDLGGANELDFVRSTHPIPGPTATVWGPDGRLYVTELFGLVHALTYDADGTVLDDEVISGLTDDLGERLTLGIAVDPASTADAIALWLAHSSPSLDDGVPNSGMVSRLSGPGFATVEHVITGLPRAKANHATNAIHFGPDGRLYIAQGGNTGAGAPNTANTEFGTMAEQPLSAALLVADVYAPTFDGSCHNPDDIFATPPCDVEVYASGLRNTYDFVFHSNGHLYAPDNGLGVAGSFPPSPTPPCPGFGSTASWTTGGNNPGVQPDFLNRLEYGMYYGHPNPSRDECVFQDGSYQTAAPLPNWREPLAAIGDHTSSNGIVEYLADTACGALKGDLLIANFSVGDNIVRFQLGADGLSVTDSGVVAAGFSNPVPLATTADGRIAVGELGANRVTLLHPVNRGCWRSHAALPTALLDAAGAAVDGRLYAVAGKTESGHVVSLHIYDPAGDIWSRGADLPGPAVENPAAVALDGRLYVFGGSTGPFSGAVNHVEVYDPAGDTWTQLAPMPTARGGAAAGVLNGLIYVVGGMGSDGSSLATVEVYDPAIDSWSSAPALPTRRDNPAAAVLDGRLYVFGGRTRDADGTEVDGTLTTVEAFDPASGSWSARAPMPTGRRSMVAGTLDGRAQVMGGERAADGTTFQENEEYDPLSDTWRALRPMPAPRHGAAAALIGDRLYVAGGGPEAGTSFSTLTDSFGF